MGSRLSGFDRFVRDLESFDAFSLDTNACLYFLNGEERLAALVRAVLDRGEHGARINIPGIVYMEMQVRPRKLANAKALHHVREFITKTTGAPLPHVSVEELEVAALIRGVTDIHTPDALVIAGAVHAKCDVVVGNDRMFERLNERAPDLLRLSGVRMPRFIRLQEYTGDD